MAVVVALVAATICCFVVVAAAVVAAAAAAVVAVIEVHHIHQTPTSADSPMGAKTGLRTKHNNSRQTKNKTQRRRLYIARVALRRAMHASRAS